MNRKDFLRKICGGLFTIVVAKELVPVNNIAHAGISWESIPMIPSKLDAAILAQKKLQHAIIMARPPGKVIDLNYIRNKVRELKNKGEL